MADDVDLDWRSETKRKQTALPLLKKLDASPAPPARGQRTDWSGEVRATKVPPPQVEKYTGPAYFSDPGFFRMVIVFAGWTLLTAVAAMGILAANGTPAPEGIVAVASGLVGLLTGVFATKASKPG